MTYRDIQEKGYLLCKVLTGPAAYKIENTHLHFMGVYALPWEDLFDKDLPRTIKEKNGDYFELDLFAQMLMDGDIRAFEMLFTSFENIKWQEGRFIKNCREHPRDFLHKHAIENWLITSSLLFSKAKKLARIKIGKVDVLKHLHFTHNTSVSTPIRRKMTEALEAGSLDPFSTLSREININALGLRSLGNNLYALFEQFYLGNEKHVAGLIDKDGELIKDGLLTERTSALSYKGVAYFDESGYLRAKRRKQQVKDVKIQNFYSVNHMYEAFRILNTVSHFFKYQNFTVEAPDKQFLSDILNGNLNINRVELVFNEIFDNCAKRLNTIDIQENVDKDLIKQLVKDVRDNAKISGSKYKKEFVM